MRSKHHNKSQWPRLGLRNCVETFFHSRLHRRLFIVKLSRVRLNQNSCIRRSQYAPIHRDMRHYTSHHAAAIFAHHAAVIHRNGLAKELHNSAWPQAICISPAKKLANNICQNSHPRYHGNGIIHEVIVPIHEYPECHSCRNM